MKAVCATLLAVAISASTGLAQMPKPRVPPHQDPGGVPLVLFSAGIDYTQPHIAMRLARDGEGEPIAWDFVDNSPHPFDARKGQAPAHQGGDATALASLLLADAVAIRLIPLRVDAHAPASLAQAVAFVAKTPARVVVVPMWSQEARDWEPFRQTALRFKRILFLVSAGDGGDPGRLFPAALDLENMMTISACPAIANAKGFGGMDRKVTGGALAAATSARAAAKILAREPQIDMARLKQGILAATTGKP